MKKHQKITRGGSCAAGESRDGERKSLEVELAALVRAKTALTAGKPPHLSQTNAFPCPTNTSPAIKSNKLPLQPRSSQPNPFIHPKGEQHWIMHESYDRRRRLHFPFSTLFALLVDVIKFSCITK
jgi:hypothetical protein